jgi:hypothetical protein
MNPKNSTSQEIMKNQTERIRNIVKLVSAQTQAQQTPMIALNGIHATASYRFMD